MSLFHFISPLLGAPPITLLLQSIVSQYLSNSFCLTFVSEELIDFKFNLTFTYITPNGTLEELQNQLLEVSEKRCSDYIVNMRDPLLFMAAFDVASRSGKIRRSDRKIVFLPHSEDTNSINMSQQLFSMKETNYVTNILLILPRKQRSDCVVYDMVTHKFRGSDVEMNQLLYLNQWDSCLGQFKTSANLFPHDLKNLYGKTVKVASFTYKPYVLLDLNPAAAPTRRDGMEIRIVEEFCRWINCTIELIREDENQWGEIFDNGTGIGVMGSVVEDRADMGISALYSWFEDYLFLDFSTYSIRSAVTCVAPSPRLLPSWLMPLMPFTWNMWYAVVITFIITSIALFVARGYSFDGVFLIVFGVMVSQSQNNAESTWRVRRVTGWLLIAGLILASAYGGGLASTFTVPKYESSIDTVQDLVDRKMEWGATHDAWIFSLTMSNEPLVKKLVSQFRINSEKEMKRKSFTRKMAFSVEKLPAGYFAIGDYLTKEALLDMTLMLEDFYYELCVVMLRKSSPYTEKISTLIGRLHQSGLFLAWETQVALKHLNYKVQQEVKLSRLKSDVGFVKSLRIKDVVGVYILFAIGIVCSILLFLIERYTYKSLEV